MPLSQSLAVAQLINYWMNPAILGGEEVLQCQPVKLNFLENRLRFSQPCQLYCNGQLSTQKGIKRFWKRKRRKMSSRWECKRRSESYHWCLCAVRSLPDFTFKSIHRSRFCIVIWKVRTVCVVYGQQERNNNCATVMMMSKRGDEEGLDAVFSLTNWRELWPKQLPVRNLFSVLYTLKSAIANWAKLKLGLYQINYVTRGVFINNISGGNRMAVNDDACVNNSDQHLVDLTFNNHRKCRSRYGRDGLSAEDEWQLVDIEASLPIKSSTTNAFEDGSVYRNYLLWDKSWWRHTKSLHAL